MFRRVLIRFLFTQILFGLVGCKTVDSDQFGQAGKPKGLTTPGFEFLVQFYSTWESGGDEELQQECGLRLGTARGTTLGRDECVIEIPEAQLYFSDIKVKMKAHKTSQCAIISYFPYHYRKSVSAGFVPELGADPIDCSILGDDTPVDCYGGPVAEVVSTFPAYTGIYTSLNSGNRELEFTVPAANSLQKPSNRFISNDMPEAWFSQDLCYDSDSGSADYGKIQPCSDFGAMEPNVQVYVANSMRDYKFSCRDEHNETIYQVTARIKDKNVDSGSSGYDDFPTWDYFFNFNLISE